MEPVTPELQPAPQEESPAVIPLQSEPLPAGADAVPPAEAGVDAPPPAAAEAAFTASPMPEEEARKALQAPPPVAEDAAASQPVPTAPADPVSVPAPEGSQPQPADAGMGIQ